MAYFSWNNSKIWNIFLFSLPTRGDIPPPPPPPGPTLTYKLIPCSIKVHSSTVTTWTPREAIYSYKSGWFVLIVGSNCAKGHVFLNWPISGQLTRSLSQCKFVLRWQAIHTHKVILLNKHRHSDSHHRECAFPKKSLTIRVENVSSSRSTNYCVCEAGLGHCLLLISDLPKSWRHHDLIMNWLSSLITGNSCTVTMWPAPVEWFINGVWLWFINGNYDTYMFR